MRTMCELLVSMSQNTVKQKGVEIKDVKIQIDQELHSTISVLTYEASSKMILKTRTKKYLMEEAECKEIGKIEEEMKKLAKEESYKGSSLYKILSDIQLEMKADRLSICKLHEEERETFTVEERAKFLYDTILLNRRGKKHADLKNKNFEEIQVLYKEVKRSDKNFIAIGSAEDERQIKEMNEESKDPKKKRLKKRVVNETPREEDTAKVPAEQEVTEQGTKKRKSGHVKMIARKRPRPQPDDDSDDEHRKCLRIVTFDSTIDSEIMETKSFVSKLHKVSSPDGDYLVVYRVNGHFRAFNYLMEVEVKVTAALHLVQIHVAAEYEEHQELTSPEANGFWKESWLVPGSNIPALTSKQTAFGKDKSNPLIVDSLLKTIRLSIHLVVYNEELAIPEQTATGKGISNPLMAGSLPKTTKPTSTIKPVRWPSPLQAHQVLLTISQMNANDKNSLGYGTQMDEMSNKFETDSEISMSIFEVRSSDEEITSANDRFSKADGYHAVPSPITGNLQTVRPETQTVKTRDDK
ncbi:hypothetical protein Tco_0242012, partial [Tanacetum coccineum]